MKLKTLFVVTLVLFFSSISIALAQDGNATVTRSILNFRDNPSINGNVIQKIVLGSSYPVLAQTVNGYWYQIEVDGVKGWVCSHLVSIDIKASDIPKDSSVVDEDCRGNSVNVASERTYRAVKQYEDNGSIDYAILDASTDEVLFVTTSQYPGSTNDVKAGRFNADYTKFAAAYHYSGDYTWIGVWSVPDGTFLYSRTKDGFVYSVSGAFD